MFPTGFTKAASLGPDLLFQSPASLKRWPGFFMTIWNESLGVFANEVIMFRVDEFSRGQMNKTRMWR